MGYIGTFSPKTTAVLGVPIGKINDLNTRVSRLEQAGSGLTGSQEKSTTTPNSITQVFAFTHTPKIIYWNGQFQTLTDDYTVSGNSITFVDPFVPLIGDKVVNVY